MAAYYNENNAFGAETLRRLIAINAIAPGDVDSRSIEDVAPLDLRGYTQCHFFAGIGGWSLALRLAGWPDDEHVWTGSCPCQPFSTAGAGAGFADERHLWPAWFWLIEQQSPRVLLGEQVEAAIAHGWLDLVQSDLEAEGYAFAAFGLPAAGVGAPHERRRLYFAADTGVERRARLESSCHPSPARPWGLYSAETLSAIVNAPFEHSDCWGTPILRKMDDGFPGRVAALHAYGNAIVPQVAAEFVAAYMECRGH